jgi:hypothetical protein
MLTLGKCPSYEMGTSVCLPFLAIRRLETNERPSLQLVMANMCYYMIQPSSWVRKTVRWVTIRDLHHRLGNSAVSSPLGGGDKVEGGLQEEEEEELAP